MSWPEAVSLKDMLLRPQGAGPTARGAALCPGRGPSGGQGLNVLQHVLEGLRGRGLRVPEGSLDPAVQTEGFQLQPDEPEAVLVEQDEDPRGALRAGEAVAGDEASAVKTEKGGRPRERGEGWMEPTGTFAACRQAGGQEPAGSAGLGSDPSWLPRSTHRQRAAQPQVSELSIPRTLGQHASHSNINTHRHASDRNPEGRTCKYPLRPSFKTSTRLMFIPCLPCTEGGLLANGEQLGAGHAISLPVDRPQLRGQRSEPTQDVHRRVLLSAPPSPPLLPGQLCGTRRLEEAWQCRQPPR